jgi:A/G-specific adenine glycosylase
LKTGQSARSPIAAAPTSSCQATPKSRQRSSSHDRKAVANGAPHLSHTAIRRHQPTPRHHRHTSSRSRSRSSVVVHRKNSKKMSQQDAHAIANGLEKWFGANKRALPWRRDASDSSKSVNDRGYATWVSEIMLQQTQVATVVGYYERWMQRWPTVESLSRASLDDVTEMWSGLGYYRRARLLHSGAEMVQRELGGIVPSIVSELIKIPGVGRYTAGAVASIAFGRREAVVDGNVVRVLSRLHTIGADPKAKESVDEHWRLAKRLVDASTRAGVLNEALMELGATVCKPANANCAQCPISGQCGAFAELQQKRADGDHEWSVAVYPRKVVKPLRRDEHWRVFIVELVDDDAQPPRYLFVKRADTGLLARMWQFVRIQVEGAPTDAPSSMPSQLFVFFESMGIKLRVSSPSNSNASSSSSSSASSSPSSSFRTMTLIDCKSMGSCTHLFTHIRHLLHVCHVTASAVDALSGDGDTETVRWLSAEQMESAAISTGTKKAFALLAKSQKRQRK